MIAVLTISITVATPARADDAEPIHVVFRAPAGCPDEAAFIGQVIARTARARVAAASEPGRTFAITIRVEGARTRGRLTIDAAHGAPATRDVVGGSCEEVVSALGLVTALAIDPGASTAPTAALPAPAVPPPAPPLGPPPRYDALPWWGPIGAPLPVIPAVSDGAPASRWRAGWGLLFGGASAVAPGLVFTLAGFAEIARTGDGIVSPAFRLAIAEADTGFRVVGAGQRARFALVTGRVEACRCGLTSSARSPRSPTRASRRGSSPRAAWTRWRSAPRAPGQPPARARGSNCGSSIASASRPKPASASR